MEAAEQGVIWEQVGVIWVAATAEVEVEAAEQGVRWVIDAETYWSTKRALSPARTACTSGLMRASG